MQNAVNCNEFSDPWVIMFLFLLPIFEVATSKSALTCRRSFISCGLSFVSFRCMQASLLDFFSKLDELAETFLEFRSECYTCMCRHQSGMKIIFSFFFKMFNFLAYYNLAHNWLPRNKTFDGKP